MSANLLKLCLFLFTARFTLATHYAKLGSNTLQIMYLVVGYTLDRSANMWLCSDQWLQNLVNIYLDDAIGSDARKTVNTTLHHKNALKNPTALKSISQVSELRDTIFMSGVQGRALSAAAGRRLVLSEAATKFEIRGLYGH